MGLGSPFEFGLSDFFASLASRCKWKGQFQMQVELRMSLAGCRHSVDGYHGPKFGMRGCGKFALQS